LHFCFDNHSFWLEPMSPSILLNSSCGLDHFYYYPTVLSLLCFYWKQSCSLDSMKTNAAVTSTFWLCFLRKAIRSYFDLGAEYTFLKITFTLTNNFLMKFIVFIIASSMIAGYSIRKTIIEYYTTLHITSGLDDD
jgi:hypothetical protein